MGETKRKLTLVEIQDILSSIPVYAIATPNVYDYNYNLFIGPLKKELERVEIYPTKIPCLKAEIYYRMQKAIVQPRTVVGLQMGTSLGSGNTQATLSSFHSVSALSLTSITLNKIEDIINATHDVKSSSISTVYFAGLKDNINVYSKSQADFLNSFYQHTQGGEAVYLHNLIENIVSDDPIDNVMLAVFLKTYSCNQTRNMNYKYTLTLDQKQLFKYKILLEEVAKVIEAHFPIVEVYFSPQSIGKIYLYSIVEVNIENISALLIKGYSNIEKILFSKCSQSQQWIGYFYDLNFADTLSIPYVDSQKSVNNSIWQIFNTLGIDAAQKAIFKEIKAANREHGATIDDVYIRLLSKIMTKEGVISGVNRYTIKKDLSMGFLSASSFESPIDSLVHSALFNEKDNIKSTVSCLLTGKEALFGGGGCTVKLNTNKLT